MTNRRLQQPKQAPAENPPLWPGVGASFLPCTSQPACLLLRWGEGDLALALPWPPIALGHKTTACTASLAIRPWKKRHSGGAAGLQTTNSTTTWAIVTLFNPISSSPIHGAPSGGNRCQQRTQGSVVKRCLPRQPFPSRLQVEKGQLRQVRSAVLSSKQWQWASSDAGS